MVHSFRKYHKWLSLFFTLFILIFAVSGIILNHRDLFSSSDIARKWMPRNYSWKNWNLASVKGSVRTGSDSMLVFGNVGVWLTDSSCARFTDFNKGFPRGIDNRKITSVARTPAGDLFAGTLFGLYRYDWGSGRWASISLPVKERRIVRVLSLGDSLLVMTRSNLMWTSMKKFSSGFQIIPVPAAINDDNRTGLFKTLWVIHSGEIYGMVGKLIVDAAGILFIIICITGLIWFTMPYLLPKASERLKSRLKRFNRNSLRWHNWLGSWFLPVLLLTTITGMFLRPPLLIPIANTRVAKIKFSELDSPNPWFDRFRDLLYDKEKGVFLIATSEGIYFSADRFNTRLRPFAIQPPVSVMGINVLEIIEPGRYLVGSFSGIFDWNPKTGEIIDYFTGLEFVDSGQRGSPFGNLTVAGYIKLNSGKEYIFDYAAGSIGLKSSPPFVPMPESVKNNSPISLWNAMLEIHTGRIFEPIMGQFYILVVPVTGIFTFFILVTGFFSWWLKRRGKNYSQ